MNNIVYNEKEYAKLLYKATRKVRFITSLVGALSIGFISFILTNEISGKIVISAIISISISIIFYIFLKIILYRTIKLNNNLDKVEKVEQIINDNEIIETVYLKNGKINEGIYKYNDIFKVRDDNSNYYLYITGKYLIVISKNKIKDMNKFNEILSLLKK